MDLPDGVFMIPEGRYSFEIIGATRKESKATGNEYCMLKCRVIFPPYEGTIIHKPIVTPVVSARAAWVWEEVLTDPFDPRNVGLRFDAEVRHEVYQDQERVTFSKMERYVP
jgi:hypothetical protein